MRQSRIHSAILSPPSRQISLSSRQNPGTRRCSPMTNAARFGTAQQSSAVPLENIGTSLSECHAKRFKMPLIQLKPCSAGEPPERNDRSLFSIAPLQDPCASVISKPLSHCPHICPRLLMASCVEHFRD